MKVQLQGQHLRLRIDESELAALRTGTVLENVTRLGAITWRQTLRQTNAMGPALDAKADACAIGIPRSLVDDYAARLPCREGLRLLLQSAEGVAIDFMLEVDVRDSIRTRGPKRT